MALSDYALVPVVNNPTEGVIDNWLRIGSNLSDRDNWISTIYSSNLVKCAYYNSSGDVYYYIAVMTYSENWPLSNVVYANDYYSSVYHLKGYTLHHYTAGSSNLVSNTLGQIMQSSLNGDIPVYTSQEEALRAMDDGIWNSIRYPITYRPTNCSFPGAPTEAAIGDIVVVPVSFPDGYGLVNESNIYVTNNGVVIPSSYSNGQLTFTMPDPS